MNRSDYADEPAAVAAYFGPAAVHERGHADIVQVYYPTGPRPGWINYGTAARHRITVAWARALRRQGATAVALSCGGRLADFTLPELTRRTPLTRRPRP